MGDEDASYNVTDYDTDPYFRQTSLEFALRLHRAGEDVIPVPAATVLETARLFYNFITNKNS